MNEVVRVVDLVRDAGGDLSEGSHLVGADHLPLRSLEVREVEERSDPFSGARHHAYRDDALVELPAPVPELGLVGARGRDGLLTTLVRLQRLEGPSAEER